MKVARWLSLLLVVPTAAGCGATSSTRISSGGPHRFRVGECVNVGVHTTVHTRGGIEHKFTVGHGYIPRTNVGIHSDFAPPLPGPCPAR